MSNVTGFDYSYKPGGQAPPVAQIPLYSGPKESTEKEPSVDIEDSEKPRGQFERKMSDADIVFGAIKVSSTGADSSSFKPSSYARNRSNSSFTSTSTDSNYVYGSRDARRDNSFQKSLSVSSDKDGDFTHDPTVLSSRAGISNDAFTDYDSPKTSTTSSATKLWSNNDDEYDLK